jgi:hypothetical protein
MDTNPHRPDDLSEVQRRLAAWEPATDGLATDAMLFAAGRASVRPGLARFVWPALTGLLTALSVTLGLWLVGERSERLALAQRLHDRPPVPAPAVNPSSPPTQNATPDAVPAESPVSEEPPPDSYLASRPALEKGLDAWPLQAVVRGGPSDSPATTPPILRLGQREALLDP